MYRYNKTVPPRSAAEQVLICNSTGHSFAGLPSYITSATTLGVVAMTGKCCDVLGVLANLAAVFLLIRCGTVTRWMRAFLGSGHTSPSSPSGMPAPPQIGAG